MALFTTALGLYGKRVSCVVWSGELQGFVSAYYWYQC
jgi:hypothetical protein